MHQEACKMSPGGFRAALERRARGLGHARSGTTPCPVTFKHVRSVCSARKQDAHPHFPPDIQWERNLL